MYKIPELLAPAGGLEQLKAAVENGADAVYIGGKLLNARMNANNFDNQEIAKAVEYAHLRGVKIYVTLNTLISDEELNEALHYAAELYEYGVDALILQDLGFAELLKKQIPGMPIHLSTQGTVYNIEGVRAAKNLGFSRVVLARELSLEEIKGIAEENLIEIEVFVHGALCICYSGQCQMSREIGGRSGNRGVCAQPCRLPYSIYKEEMGKKIEMKGPSYVLSPKDLCTIEHIDKLSRSGISSLKIEGRMKSPEYVAIVTKIYRKYLDIYERTGEIKVEKKDLDDLNQIFNRGGFTEGYLFHNPGKNLMSGNLPKHQGVYIGKVNVATESKSLGNHQRGLVTIKLEKHLSIGDGIEIRNEELSGNIITFMKVQNKKVSGAKPGEIVTIGYIDGRIKAGDQVYKITDKNLMADARESFEAKSGIAEKSLRKVDINFQFEASLNRPISLKVTDMDGNSVTKIHSIVAEKALTKPLTKEVVITQLNKTGGTIFRVKECILDIEVGISVPLSVINELRRLSLEELEEIRKNILKKTIDRNDWQIVIPDKSKTKIKSADSKIDQFHLYLFHADQNFNDEYSFSRIYLPYDVLLDGYSKDGIELVPVIPNITRGWHDQNIRKNFDKILKLASISGIAIGNIGWISPFVSSGINVYGDFGLNVYNSMDFLQAKQLGLKEAVISHEVSNEEISKMDFHGIEPEVVIDGRVPLMISEHCFIGDFDACTKSRGKFSENDNRQKSRALCKSDQYFLQDRKGEFYPIIQNHKSCQNIIFSYKSNNHQNNKESLRRIGVNRFRIYGI